MPEDPPVNTTPIVFRPETFARHHNAVEYVEGLIRTRAPLPDTGRFPGNKPGAWGLLAPGDTISAGSGLTLGSGTVTLCTRAGSTLTDTGQSVTVYNNGAAITAPAYGYGDGLAVAMEWTEAGWSACECEPSKTEPVVSPGCCTGGSTLPLTLQLTDALGTLPITYRLICQGGGPAVYWAGGRTLPGVTVRNDSSPCSTPSTGTGTLGILYVLLCSSISGVTKWTLSRNWFETLLSGSTFVKYNSTYDGISGGCINKIGPCLTPLAVASFHQFPAVNCSSFSLSSVLNLGGGVASDPIGGTVTVTK